MKALILVGGFGTRLRPLTFKKAKPLVPFVNKPMIIHQVEALKAVGVTEVILAIAYQPDAMKAEMDEWGTKIGVKFTYSVETTPLGTAGPLALAKDSLLAGAKDDEPFFVLNSDVTCKFPFAELLQFHKNHKKEGTIMVTQVKDWSKYGVVVYDEKDGKISRFVEKPQEFCGDRINAGIYIFNNTILKRIPLARTSIETQVFPNMAADGQLYCMTLEGFWADIGQPHDYIDGLKLFMSAVGNNAEKKAQLNIVSAEEAKAKGFTVEGSVAIHPTATVAAGAVIGPNVTIDANCKIGACSRLQDCAVLENSTIGTGCFITRTIVGWNNRIGNWCRLENNCVFGDDVGVKDGLALDAVKILPNKDMKESAKDKIIM